MPRTKIAKLFAIDTTIYRFYETQNCVFLTGWAGSIGKPKTVEDTVKLPQEQLKYFCENHFVIVIFLVKREMSIKNK